MSLLKFPVSSLKRKHEVAQLQIQRVDIAAARPAVDGPHPVQFRPICFMTPNRRRLVELLGALPPSAPAGGAALQPLVENQQLREVDYSIFTSRAVTAHGPIRHSSPRRFSFLRFFAERTYRSTRRTVAFAKLDYSSSNYLAFSAGI